jgi:hypothetical protein
MQGVSPRGHALGRLSERLGQPFVVENQPDATTNVATEAVERVPPDGYTAAPFRFGGRDQRDAGCTSPQKTGRPKVRI